MRVLDPRGGSFTWKPFCAREELRGGQQGVGRLVMQLLAYSCLVLEASLSSKAGDCHPDVVSSEVLPSCLLGIPIFLPIGVLCCLRCNCPQ